MPKDQKRSPNLRQLLGMKEPSDRGKNPLMKKTHFTIWYVLIAFLIIVLIQNYLTTKKVEEIIPYSDFKESVTAGKVKDLVIMDEIIAGQRETEKGL